MTAEDVALFEAAYALQKNYFVPRHTSPLSGDINRSL